MEMLISREVCHPGVGLSPRCSLATRGFFFSCVGSVSLLSVCLLVVFLFHHDYFDMELPGGCIKRGRPNP